MILEFGQEFSRDASRRCTLCYFFNERGKSFEVGVTDTLTDLWQLNADEVRKILPIIGFERLLTQLQRNTEDAESVILTSENTSNTKPAEFPEYYCSNLKRSESKVNCSKFGKLEDDIECKLSGSCKSCWQYEVQT